MKKGDAGVARRYAAALLDVVSAGGDPAAFRKDLEGAASLLQEHPELRAVLSHPAVPPEKKKSVLAAIWKREDVSPLLPRLLDMLAERGRLALLPQIARAYAARWNAQRGVVQAEAVSAVPLDESQKDALKTAVRKVTGSRDVELENRVDAALMGGVLLQMQGRSYDGSVRGRLLALRERLVGGS